MQLCHAKWSLINVIWVSSLALAVSCFIHDNVHWCNLAIPPRLFTELRQRPISGSAPASPAPTPRQTSHIVTPNAPGGGRNPAVQWAQGNGHQRMMSGKNDVYLGVLPFRSDCYMYPHTQQTDNSHAAVWKMEILNRGESSNLFVEEAVCLSFEGCDFAGNTLLAEFFTFFTNNEQLWDRDIIQKVQICRNNDCSMGSCRLF